MGPGAICYYCYLDPLDQSIAEGSRRRLWGRGAQGLEDSNPTRRVSYTLGLKP